ncbi:ABC transporter [Microbacterium soli]|uniref:ABC transporter n=1 Tax=Microbacterium soli TaxID=446075 RepID=A0ABP7N9E4_9MICO
MSDPEVPQNDKPNEIDDVIGSANEGLDAAAAARGDEPTGTAPAVDPDEAAFAAAERDFPGTFSAPAAAQTDAEQAGAPAPATADQSGSAVTPTASEPVATASASEAPVPVIVEEASATGAGAASAAAAAAETQVVPAEPIAPPAAPQPIFVQAPEPPRELGNRGAAGGIGLVAAVAFGILYLGAVLGLGALAGDVTGANVGTAAVVALGTWSFWVPVVVFFLAFWLLGAFVNRARWGVWVILGILVAAASYGGHILGQLFQAPFWSLTPSAAAELMNEQMLAPLAVAAFVFARELTIWFGAWVARSGAHKKELNAEAQAEYERTLEAGPAALR